MEMLDKWILSFGVNNIIMCGAGLLAFIVVIFIYRFIKLKMYRKEIVALENTMNAVKTLPIQYRLGRVQGISKNMPEIAEKYDEYAAEYEKISTFQTNTIASLVNEIDEQLFYRKLKGAKNKLRKLKEIIHDYDDQSKELLNQVEEITEIENVQRIAIIKIKEKYRGANDSFVAVRFKIEDFVPAIPQTFEEIDKRFVELESLMNHQQFDDAKEYADKIDQDVDLLVANLRDLPTYISIVRKYIPKRLDELNNMISNMKDRGFAIENLHATKRHEKISQDLINTIEHIKKLELETVGISIETMTEELNVLYSDFEKEEAAFNAYQEKRTECYDTVGTLDTGLKETLISLEELKSNYILEEYNLNIGEDYENFKEILDQLVQYSAIIEENDFSYNTMIENFNSLLEQCKPYEDILNKYNQLKESLRLQEKRALDELDNINIVLLEIKSEIKNKHLPMINESYKDYINDSYQKADEILNFTRKRPIDLESLSRQVDAARDVIYKLYDNVHNLIVTAEMVEDAILYGNRYRSSFLEVNTELTKAELLFRNGEYTKALTTAVDIIEKIRPGSYEMLVNNNNREKV